MPCCGDGRAGATSGDSAPDDDDEMVRARRARAHLEREIIHHPDVTLIDIGLAQGPESGDAAPPAELVLRIHVRGYETGSAPEESDDFPDSIEGFRVVLEPGDYQLE